jgi:hypothetical protein
MPFAGEPRPKRGFRSRKAMSEITDTYKDPLKRGTDKNS